MTRSRTTSGKRNVQQAKREKAQTKQERRAARRNAVAVEPSPVVASEAELIDELAKLHGALESGEVSPQVFEERREVIRTQLEQIGNIEG